MEGDDAAGEIPSVAGSKAAARVLLEHVTRGWAAEEERARLIQRQQQLAVAVLLAATGAFFTAAVAALADRSGWTLWCGLALLLTALCAAGGSFTTLIQSRRSARSTGAED